MTTRKGATAKRPAGTKNATKALRAESAAGAAGAKKSSAVAPKSRHKSNRAWIDRHINDPYVRDAQQQGYRSRAAFKLIELIDLERVGLPGHTVVDLGSVPGAWSQVLAKRVAPQGRVVALDMLPMDPVHGVEFLQGDFREEDVLRRFEVLVGDQLVDLVASDMAPNLSGVAVADAARMGDLAELAVDFAVSHLSADGVLLVKCFHGSGFSQLVHRFKSVFRQVRERKPGASRPESAETYLIGRALKEPLRQRRAGAVGDNAAR